VERNDERLRPIRGNKVEARLGAHTITQVIVTRHSQQSEAGRTRRAAQGLRG
jgi:hypothetical protein